MKGFWAEFARTEQIGIGGEPKVAQQGRKLAGLTDIDGRSLFVQDPHGISPAHCEWRGLSWQRSREAELRSSKPIIVPVRTGGSKQRHAAVRLLHVLRRRHYLHPGLRKEDLEKLFAVCRPDERLWSSFS